MENIDSLIKNLQELNVILEKENYFLENYNLQEVTNLYSQKERLTRELKKISDLDSISLTSFNDLDFDRRNELNLMINSFRQLKDKNSSLLATAIEKNKILVDEIKNDLLKLDIKDFNYFKELNKNIEPYIINEKV